MFYIFHNGPSGQHISLCRDVVSALEDLTAPYTPPDDPFIGSLQDPPWEHNYACSPAYHTVSRLLKPKEVVVTLAPELRKWMRECAERHGGCHLELQSGLGKLHSFLDDEQRMAVCG